MILILILILRLIPTLLILIPLGGDEFPHEDPPPASYDPNPNLILNPDPDLDLDMS